jgi:hypothetical protein
MEMAKSFKTAINRTFSDKGGVFWEKVNDQQLRSFLMGMMREFASNDSSKQVIGSLVIGRQPNPRRVDNFGEFVNADATDGEFKDDYDNAVYILNENVQVICGRQFLANIRYRKKSIVYCVYCISAAYFTV